MLASEGILELGELEGLERNRLAWCTPRSMGQGTVGACEGQSPQPLAEGLRPSDLGRGLGAGGAGAVGAARAGGAAGAAALARRAADLRGAEGPAISWLVGQHNKAGAIGAIRVGIRGQASYRLITLK